MKSKVIWQYIRIERVGEINRLLLGGGNGGAGGILDPLLVGAPGGADDIDDVELFEDPKK